MEGEVHICFPMNMVCGDGRKPNSQVSVWTWSGFCLCPGNGRLEEGFTSLSFGGVKEPREGLCEGPDPACKEGVCVGGGSQENPRSAVDW